MGKVTSEISMSLDGFITGPNVRVGNGMGDDDPCFLTSWDFPTGLPARCRYEAAESPPVPWRRSPPQLDPDQNSSGGEYAVEGCGIRTATVRRNPGQSPKPRMFAEETLMLSARLDRIRDRNTVSFEPPPGDAHGDGRAAGQVPPPAIAGCQVHQRALAHVRDGRRVLPAGLPTCP